MRSSASWPILLLLLFNCHYLTLTSASGSNRTDPDRSETLHLPRNAKRFALIVAPVGDGSFHTKWLASAKEAGRNWDLAVLYYGRRPFFRCRECVAVIRTGGAKWRLMSGFLNSTVWTDQLSQRYEMVMVADDDLDMQASRLNRFFKIFRDFRLLIAQPSVCP